MAKLYKKAVEALEEGGKAIVKQFALPKSEKPLRKSPDTIKKEERVAAPKGMPLFSDPATRGKLTAAQRRQQSEFLAENERVTGRQGLKAGRNVMPKIIPPEEELGLIRRMHGESGIVRKPGDLGEGSAGAGTEPYVDASQTKGLFPPSAPRTRPQTKLTRIEALPEDLPPRITDMINNPQVRARIKEAAEAGRSVQGWYDTTPLEQIFTKEFGQEEGMKRFSDFMSMVAGTSTGNKIGSNIRTGSHYYAQKYGGGRDFGADPIQKGLDVQGELIRRYGQDEGKKRFRDWEAMQAEGGSAIPGDPSFEVPPDPYGHMYQQTHMSNVNQLGESGGDLSSLDNPKIAAFFENLMGNWAPTTLDKHAIRLGGMASRDPRWMTPQGTKSLNDMMAAGIPQEEAVTKLLDQPTNWLDITDTSKGEYAAMEQMWDDIAKEMGVSPAELQAMAWVGGGKQTGLGSAPVTFMDAFADRIRRTAIRDNIPPDQVLKLMVQGRMTLAELMQQEQAPGGPQIG